MMNVPAALPSIESAPSQIAPDADPVRLKAALDGLRDIQLPEIDGSIGLSADVWTTLALVGLAGLGYWLIRRYMLRSPRNLALAKLAALKKSHRLGALSPLETVAACTTLLRRFAISMYPPEDVAGLTGQRWNDYLANISGPSHNANALLAPLIGVEPYRSNGPTLDIGQVLDDFDAWLRNARTPDQTFFDKAIWPRQGLDELYP